MRKPAAFFGDFPRFAGIARMADLAMAVEAVRKVQSRWRRLGRWAQWTIIVIVVVLVAFRLSLPWVVKHYVNERLNRIPEYSGHVAEVHMHLWRGAYEIDGVEILKSNGKVPMPFFNTPSIDLAIDTPALLHRRLVGSVVITDPRLNFVEGPTPETSQSGFNKPWGKTLESLFPFDINRFTVRGGRIHFRSDFKGQPVDIYMTNLTAVATNLTNAKTIDNPLPAGLTAGAETIGGGNFALKLRMNPLDPAPTFELNAMLTNVNLIDLNNFLRAYGKFDVERGRFQLFTSVASENGNYHGHVKVLFQNLDVFAWEKDKHKNILQFFWEAVVGTLAAGFKNHPHDQLATDVPISGNFAATKVDIWGAVGSLLHNAFIRALLPRIDYPAHLDTAAMEANPPPITESQKSRVTEPAGANVAPGPGR